MTAAEAERLRKVEIWQASHEELCRGRHVAIEGRFVEVEDSLAAKLGRQDLLRLVSTIAIIASIVLSGTSHGKAVLEIFDRLFL